MKAEALNQAEFSELCAWRKANYLNWPEHIQSLHDRLLKLYESLAQDKKNSAYVLETLRQAMGLSPKKESPSQLENK